MKLNLRTIGKVGFLLVVIGFFMPVACEMNGPQIAEFMVDNNMVLDGILMYVLLISAIVGLVIAALLLTRKNVPIFADWAVLLVCIVSGLVVYFNHLSDLELQSGAYFILVGWIVALVAQIVSTVKKEA